MTTAAVAAAAAIRRVREQQQQRERESESWDARRSSQQWQQAMDCADFRDVEAHAPAMRPGMEIRLVPLLYYEAHVDAPAEECGICFAEFMADDPLRVPVCGHKFHSKCLRLWFNKTPSCPTCRHVVSIPQALESEAESAWPTRTPTRSGNTLWALARNCLPKPRRSAFRADQQQRGPWPFLDEYVP